jgi:coenzyme PQQ biosynthesis protein PqqD
MRTAPAPTAARAELTVPPDARPRLAPKARLRPDRHSGRTMLLYPERGLELNETAREIVIRCTGSATVADIVGELSGLPGAPPSEALAAEVGAFLQALADRGLLVWGAR